MVLILLCALVLQAPTTATVRGKLVDAATGAPVQHGHVLLRPGGAGDGDSFSATADATGAYEVRNVAPGTYSALAGRSGYISTPYTAPLKLAAGQIEKEVDFRLSRPVVISGTVSDADGEPVDQATVFAMQKVYRQGKMDLQPRRPIQTNDRGEFRLRDLPPGRYYVKAYKLGYSGAGSPPLVAAVYPNATRLEDAQALKLAAGEERSNVNFSLVDATLYRISGKFVDRETGQTLTNVRFGASPESAISPSGRAGEILSDGTFEIRDLAAGGYLLTATITMSGATVLYSRHIDVDGNVSGLTVAVGKGAIVKGRVRIEGADLPEKLTVRLTLRSFLGVGAPSLPTVTKPDGSFEIEHVQPGTYDVMLDRFPPAGPAAPPALFVVGADAGVTITDAATTIEIPVTIDFRVATISGKVLDADSSALLPVNVALISADPKKRAVDRYFRQVRSAHDGAFKLEGVIPGDYLIVPWMGDDAGIVLDPEVFDRIEKLCTRVTIEPSGSLTQDLHLTKELRAVNDPFQ
jgi:hypothetical protein